jgi:hypothetical protein
MKKSSKADNHDEESGNDPDLGNDNYDPKNKNDVPLSCIEKTMIIIGSLFFVLILVSIKHPNIYKKESYVSHPRRIMSTNDTRIIGYARQHVLKR